MKLTMKLIDNDSSIRNDILKALKDSLDTSLRKSIPGIKTNIQTIVRNALTAEPEYQSLISGKLKYELGIPAAQMVNNIIDLWVNNIIVKYSGIKINNRGLKSTLSLDMIQSSFEDVISNSSAVIIDAKSGASLPWLEWLLLYGGKIIVRNYRVQIGPNPRSRTGMAIMVESNRSNWRVPAEFAGTITNNWVTRAIDKIENNILDVLQSELEKNI